jgi:hypothetical protein
LARKEEPDTIIRCLKTEERTPERCSPTADRFQTLQRVARRLRNKLNASRHSTHYFAQVFRGSSNKPSNANNPSNNNPRSGPAQRICIDRHLYPKAERAIQCREQNRGSISSDMPRAFFSEVLRSVPTLFIFQEWCLVYSSSCS